MPSVEEDLTQGHRVVRDGSDIVITRVFWVRNLTDAPQFQLLEAITQAQIPSYGDQYPWGAPVEYPTFEETYVRSITAEPYGAAAAKVTVEYGYVQPATVNVSDFAGNDSPEVKNITASVASKKASKDILAADMTLTLPATRSSWPSYISEAEILKPVGTLVFERTEKTSPAARMRTYMGKINSLVEGPFAAKSLLCSNIDAVTEDGGVTWSVTYEFRYDPDLWQHRDIYKGSDGKVPPGATLQTWDILEAVDFAPLGIDFSD